MMNDFLKKVELDKEWFTCVANGDRLVEKFMDTENGKNIDLKIKVLKALNSGQSPNEIEDYDKVVKVPKGIWD